MKLFEETMVAVTGGCGFIGSHLIDRLRTCGARVLAIDSLEYGRQANLDGSDTGIRVEKLKLRSGTRDGLKNLLSGVDYVFHLAAEKHNQSVGDPAGVLDSNVSGTYELLEAAAASRVKKVVFTSSLYAYGRMTAPPMSESDVPVPDTVYGLSKLSGEALCRHFAFHRGLSAVCLRLFFVYGPRQYSGLGYKSVIVKNFERLLNGDVPLVRGDGRQELDYIYVDDVVSAMLLASAINENFEIFNVGNSCPVSINHLTRLMLKIAGLDVDCEYGPADSTAGSSRVANTTKFDERFGAQPRVTLEDGLKRTFEWIASSRR